MVGNCGLTMVHWGDNQFDDGDRDDHKNLISMILKIKRYLDVEKKHLIISTTRDQLI